MPTGEEHANPSIEGHDSGASKETRVDTRTACQKMRQDQNLHFRIGNNAGAIKFSTLMRIIREGLGENLKLGVTD